MQLLDLTRKDYNLISFLKHHLFAIIWDQHTFYGTYVCVKLFAKLCS